MTTHKGMPGQSSLSKIQRNVRDSRTMTGARRLVFDALLLRAQPDGQGRWTCFPGYDLVAKDAGVHIKTVSREVLALEDAGFLRRRPRGPRSMKFVLFVEQFEALAIAARAPRRSWNKKNKQRDTVTTRTICPMCLPQLNRPSRLSRRSPLSTKQTLDRNG